MNMTQEALYVVERKTKPLNVRFKYIDRDGEDHDVDVYIFEDDITENDLEEYEDPDMVGTWITVWVLWNEALDYEIAARIEDYDDIKQAIKSRYPELWKYDEFREVFK